MSFVIKTAKTVEEAINSGLTELGIERADAEIEIIEEPKSGFLGVIGQKDAIVKIRTKEDISSFVKDILYEEKTSAEKSNEQAETEDTETEDVIEEEVTSEEDEKSETEDAEVEDIRKDIEVEESDADISICDFEDESSDEEEIEMSETEEPEYDFEEEYKDIWEDEKLYEVSREIVSRILDEFEIEYEIESEIKDEELYITIDSDDLGIVIGNRGTTLDSIQHILSLIINSHRDEYIRVTVDANGYREKRKSKLEKVATRAAEKVLKSGRPYRLEPMDAKDRRIVHMALQNFEGVETHSEGREPYRRVIITKERR